MASNLPEATFVQGTCRICGEFGDLTFEHTPPRSAYNDFPVVLAKFEEWETGYGSEYEPEGRGGYVLCGRCNNRTGGDYGAAFAEWCWTGLRRIKEIQQKTSAVFHGEIYPLRVIKQIATIFFAINSQEYASKHPYLVKFVLDRNTKGLPPDYHFHVFWYGGGAVRQSGVTGAIDTYSGHISILSEFVHPPFGYVLSYSDRLHDRRPEDITFFADYDYGDRIDLHKRFPVLQTNWKMPGDYRTIAEIERDYLRNVLDEHGVREPDEVLHRLGL